jgi:putative restriction endonuclease
LRAYVGITDWDWYRFLRDRGGLVEVNFWQPGGGRGFRALSPGEPFLFKLGGGRKVVAGGGFFVHYSRMPVSMAWQAFGEMNGAATFSEMRRLIEAHRESPPEPFDDYEIGCIILEDPFFLQRDSWIPAPPDFSRFIMSGKRYDLGSGPGRDLWEQVLSARAPLLSRVGDGTLQVAGPMFGNPTLGTPRLRQGAFRVMVADAYGRRCAVTGEKALPTLEAAHIKPVSAGGLHRLDNGLLLRSDVHALFDAGYMTVTPNYEIRVSRRLKDDFDNGEPYYPFDGRPIALPGRKGVRPAREFLEWHGDTLFRG